MSRAIVHRLEEKLQKIAKYDNTLRCYKVQKKVRTKNVAGKDLWEKLPLRTLISKESFVRTIDSWKCPTYNEDRQLRSFVKHLFFKYRVHDMFTEVLVRHSEDLDFLRLRKWAIMLGHGMSIKNEVKGIFTAKELHFFLNGPHRTDISYNAWYAKCVACGFSPSLMNEFIKHMVSFSFSSDSTNVEYWCKIIQFFSRYLESLDAETLGELLDYLAFMQNERFKIEGRTLASLIRLSNEWHAGRRIDNDKYVNNRWEPMNIPNWKYYDKPQKLHWTVQQLITGKELAYETKIQKHCVWSYASNCVSGRSRIFTLHSIDELGDERKHLTIEVDPMSRLVRQVRGKLNRAPTVGESNILHKWIIDNGLRS
jgi:hypothetical protein